MPGRLPQAGVLGVGALQQRGVLVEGGGGGGGIVGLL